MNTRIYALALLTCLAGGMLSAPVRASPAGKNTTVSIASLPYVINAPGNYVVITNLRGSKGIIINSSHVTLDLGGFMLLGQGGTEDGIYVRGDQRDIEVRNGTITGWGSRGIMADTAMNSAFRNLRLNSNGLCGLRAGHGALLDNVVSQANGGSGAVGFEALVVNNGVFTGNMAFGLEVGQGSVVNGASVVENLGGGILADEGCRIAGNAVSGNGHGASDTASTGCSAATLAGIAVLSSGSTIVDNVLTGNQIGLQLIGDGNVVKGNVVKGSEKNYDLAAGNQLQLLLSEVPESIDWPAVVMLAGNLTGVSGESGITVNANDVTIDLAGQALQGVPGSLAGIVVTAGHVNLHVSNGTISGWGGRGVDALVATNSSFEHLILSGNGEQGLRAGNGSIVQNVNAHGNVMDGIRTESDCLVDNCTSVQNANDGIHVGEHSTVSNTVVSENTLAGIRTQDGCSVRACNSSKNSYGILAEKAATIADCTASFNSGAGIRVTGGCLVTGNLSHDNTGIGIAVIDGPGTRIDSNNMTRNGIGLTLSGQGNLAVRNSASRNTLANYQMIAPNAFGSVINVADGGSFNVSDPWANFEF